MHTRKKIFGRIDAQMLGILALMFLIALIFWNTLLIYPVKLFVVVLHEFSHGLSAILTGGKIVSIEISQQVGGLCRVMIPHTFFAQFALSSAGYLGSIFWGGLILIIASRTKYDNVLSMVIGGFLILLAALYIRVLFGFLFTVGFGVGLIILGAVADNKIVDLVMKFLGMTSCLYVIIDIKEDLIDRSGIGSDADALAQLLGSQDLSVPIGLAWIGLAIVSFLIFLWIAGRGEERDV